MSPEIRPAHLAAQVTESGGPVHLAPVQPREPGPGEVRLDVKASGICGADAGMAANPKPAYGFPITPGHEVAGVVAEVGEGVAGWEVGERAGVGWFGGSCGHCTACRSGDVVHCAGRQIPGLSYPGGWATTITVPAAALIRIPDGLFDGQLPADLVDVAEQTPVWMGAVVKVVAEYSAAFWRADGLAGAAFSRSGPLQEIHDMSGADGRPAALFGFAHAGTARSAGTDFRTAVTRQLAQLFGPQAAQPLALRVQDWSAEQWTSPPHVAQLGDYSFFGHRLYQRPALDGRLHWASTETARGYAGHIEGALAGGERAAHAVLHALPDPSPQPAPANSAA